MLVAQVFLEAMEGCHLFLSPFFVMQTRVFRVSPSTIVQIFVSPGCKNGLPLISSSGVGSPSRLSSSVSFHSFRRAFAPALQRCSFSSSSQPELLFLAGFLRSFGSCPFSHGSQALFSVLGTFVGHFESCPLAVSCEALFPLLTGFVGPFDNFPFAVTCEALFPLLAGFCIKHFSFVRHIFLNAELSDEVSRSFPATFARLHKNRAKTAASGWRQGDVRDKQTEKLRESSPLLATCGERTRRSRRCGPSSSRRPVFRIFPLQRGGIILNLNSHCASIAMVNCFP